MTSLQSIAVDPETLDLPVDLACLFAEPGAPVELEIGSGKGGFLLKQAMAHPERRFVGIEWASKYYRYSADRMLRRGITNVRVMRTDARDFVINRLASQSLAALHIYHPDPWPKRRHWKNRLFQPEFVEAAVRCLKSGARFAIQTDHAGYFEQIREVTTARSELVPIPFEDAEHGTDGATVHTNFQIKYAREGRDFYRLAFRRA